MNEIAKRGRGRGRLPTGPTTVIVRIPGVLKPVVAELVAHYRQAKQRAWEAQPLRQPDDDAGLVAAAETVLDRIARGEETTMPFAEWERRVDALDG